MGLIENENGFKHTPKRRTVFEFDDEVSKAFDDMAVRSIPMYREAHRLHVSLLKRHLQNGAFVIDVGCSTGQLFEAIEREFDMPFEKTGIEALAIDSSPHMIDILKSRYPTVPAFAIPVLEAGPLKRKADVVFAMYLLQFIPHSDKEMVLRWLVDALAPGGVLVLGQKETIHDEGIDLLFSDEYYLFRRDNGYTQEEIDAKTKALAGSMWPLSKNRLIGLLLDHELEVTETSRWLQFSTLMAHKRGV